MTLFKWFSEKIATIPMLKSSTEDHSDVPDKVYSVTTVCSKSIAMFVAD